MILADFYRKELFRIYSREVQPKNCKLLRKIIEKNSSTFTPNHTLDYCLDLPSLSLSNFPLGDTEEKIKTFTKSKLSSMYYRAVRTLTFLWCSENIYR